MNDNVLPQEIAAVLADPDGLFDLLDSIPSIVAALDGADLARPTLTISGEDMEPFGSGGRKGFLRLEIRSRVGDATSDLEHGQRVTAVSKAFGRVVGESFEETKTLEALAFGKLKEAVAARNAVNLVACGVVGQAEEIDPDDLITVLRVAVLWRFV